MGWASFAAKRGIGTPSLLSDASAHMCAEIHTGRFLDLVAPYCAILRDYLSDTPLLHVMGFFGVSSWPIGCDTPSSFLSVSPLGEHAKRRCDTPPPPPPQQGYLSDTCRNLPMKTRQNACDTPLCDTISKGYCAIWGGVSRIGPLSS